MANEVKLVTLLKYANEEASRLGKNPLSYRRYMQLTVDGILPKPDKGKIDAIKSLVHWIFYYRELSEKQGSLDFTDSRKRKEAARAEREEIMLRKLKEELVPKNASIGWLVALGSAAKQAFQGLPKRLASTVLLCDDEKEIEVIIRNEIYKIIRELEKPLNVSKSIRRKKKGAK